MAAQRTLLDAFRGEMRTSVVEFGKRLWEMDSDVFIFMARKAACFFDCMREQHLAAVRGIAISDRVLDMDLSFIQGKRVTLVDDCVFSGTTLFHAKTAVEKAGAASCNTLTLSVNRDWIRPQLLPGGDEAHLLNFAEPLLQLDDSQSVQQCYDIVRAISVFPRPYDVDFPHTRSLKISAGGLERLLRTPGWEPFDVSSHFQLDHQVRVFTVLPSAGVRASLFRSHEGLEPIAQAIKLRIYARRISAKTWAVRLVPIVVLGALDPVELVQDSCWGPSLNAKLTASGLITPKSRYRLLQFLLSTSLLRHFAGHASADATPIDAEVRSDLAEMVFGHRYTDFIEEANLSSKGIKLPRPVVEPISPTTSRFDRTPTSVSTSAELVAECVRPFTWLYRNLEIPARQAVRESGLQQSLDQTRTDLVRLGRGFSLKALTDRLSSPVIDVNRFATIFLDRAIDLGIAVPTIVEDGGAIYRAFRHGEDAVFGEAEERLTMLALKAYMESRGIGCVYGLELQKFIVLFAQIATREGTLLERLNATESVNFGCQVLSIKGHLHGPVPTLVVQDASGSIGAPFVDGNTHPAPWLVDVWADRDILRLDDGGVAPLGPGDVRNGNRLIARLKDPSDEAAQVLVAGFAEETKQALIALGADASPSESLIRSVLSDINALCARGEVWQDERLSRCATSEAAIGLVAKPPFGLPRRANFCRLLVEEAFANVINRRDFGTRYVVGEIPGLEIGPRKEARARKIGRLLGKVVGRNHVLGPRPLNNDTDLVMLSTCTEGDHQVRALSGELAILRTRLQGALDGTRRRVKHADYVGAMQYLRAHHVYIAANSGAMKYRWFFDQELPRLLDRVARHCQEVDTSGELADEWWQFWPEAAIPTVTGISPVMRGHIDAMGRWLISTNVALRLFILWILYSGHKVDVSASDVKRAADDLRDWCRYFGVYGCEETCPDMRKIVAEASAMVTQLDEDRLDDLCRRAAGVLNGPARHDFSKLLDDARLLCESYGTPGEFRPYPYALFFDAGDVGSSAGSAVDSELRIALSELDSASFRLAEASRNPWRSGQWILFRGNRSSTAAAELCARMVRLCLRRSIPFRAVLFARLSYPDSVRDMSGSLKVADEEFLRRVSAMRDQVLPNSLGNEIVCLQDATSPGLQESVKVATALGVEAPPEAEVETLDSKSKDLPTRKYLMSKFCLTGAAAVQDGAPPSGPGPNALQSGAESIASLYGRVDVGILTIREDEFEAVLARFPERRHVDGTGSDYLISEIDDIDGNRCRVAITRSPEQGPAAAQATATAMITDLNPTWLLVVGIAGGLPDSEYSLGDVLLSVRMNDFSVTAAVEGKAATYQDMGSPVVLEVQKLLATLKGVQERLGDWNGSIGPAKPRVKAPSLDSDTLYGEAAWKESVISSLQLNFPSGKAPRKPIFLAATMITGGTLLKSTELAKQWKQSARSAAAVEMELGGVARAAYSCHKGTRVLAIRGLSDIVGYRRSPAWTEFACHSAAAFCHALARSGRLRKSGTGGENLSVPTAQKTG